MSSFWDMTDGTSAATGATSFESNVELEPIPDNTGCLAAIEEASWKDYQNGDQLILIKWRIIKPEAHGGRVVMQKIKIFGTDADRAKGNEGAVMDKARRMLAAIDANAGGQLVKNARQPTDTDLMAALAGKIMGIRVQLWKMTGADGIERTGNWIGAVSPGKTAGKQTAPAQQRAPVQVGGVAHAAAQPAQAAAAAPAPEFSTDDDIPF